MVATYLVYNHTDALWHVCCFVNKFNTCILCIKKMFQAIIVIIPRHHPIYELDLSEMSTQDNRTLERIKKVLNGLSNLV